MNIREIESLTENQAKEMALETMEIKGHQVYFVDLGGYFKYSALVFKNGKHIYYANDYELHHNGKQRSVLRQWYIDTLTNKLFTETELVAPIKDYDEFDKKSYYLRNYYHLQKDYISAFRICRNKAEEEAFKRETAGLHYNPISFCYMADEKFIKHQAKLMAGLLKAKEAKSDNYEYWKDAFVREMFNHEYAINWQADYDTLSAFGNVEWKGDDANLADYFDQLNFTETQRKAYRDARHEYYKKANEADMF